MAAGIDAYRSKPGNREPVRARRIEKVRSTACRRLLQRPPEIAMISLREPPEKEPYPRQAPVCQQRLLVVLVANLVYHSSYRPR